MDFVFSLVHRRDALRHRLVMDQTLYSIEKSVLRNLLRAVKFELLQPLTPALLDSRKGAFDSLPGGRFDSGLNR